MKLLDPIALATPAFILLVIGEMLAGWLWARAHYETRDTATSLLMGLGSTVMGGLFAFIYIAYAGFVVRFAPFDLGWSLAAFIACFVIDDFYYYWWHRLSHRVRWLWADHVQHHSSQHYNLSTALRQPWTGAFTPGLLLRTPMFLLGFPLAMLAFVHGLNLIYQFWIHTEAIRKFPRWFEAAMNTPSHHRVHHATNAGYLDANYAGVFIVWDRLFGTFVPEDERDPPRYGLVRNLGTFNPIKVALHEWVSLARDLARARSLKTVLGHLFAPPGWSPDGSRQTSDSIKAAWARHRTAPSPPPADPPPQ